MSLERLIQDPFHPDHPHKFQAPNEPSSRLPDETDLGTPRPSEPNPYDADEGEQGASSSSNSNPGRDVNAGQEKLVVSPQLHQRRRENIRPKQRIWTIAILYVS